MACRNKRWKNQENIDYAMLLHPNRIALFLCPRTMEEKD